MGSLAPGTVGTSTRRASWRPEVFEPSDVGAGAGTGKRGVFREEAITRMKCIAARAARHLDQFVNTEIAFTRRRGADGVGFVGQPDVQRFAVGLAKNGNGLNAKFAARANDTHGDLAAISNQDFLEHRDY